MADTSKIKRMIEFLRKKQEEEATRFHRRLTLLESAFQRMRAQFTRFAGIVGIRRKANRHSGYLTPHEQADFSREMRKRMQAEEDSDIIQR